jgi:1-phosphofructokinase family hexose kinase
VQQRLLLKWIELSARAVCLPDSKIMICAVSLNPAVDKYLRLTRLRAGEHQEAMETVTSAGGKAVNVAGVARVLGEEVLVVGFFGGYTGEYLRTEIAREGIQLDTVEIATISRTAFVVVEDSAIETEIVEPGGAVTAAELDELRRRFRAAVQHARIVVLSGSVPPGCPDDVYAQLLDDVGGRCPVLLDTSRQWLRLGLEARSKPLMIKPNRREAQELIEMKLRSTRDFVSALRLLVQRGVRWPLISDGERGIYALLDERFLHARAPTVRRINSVGSGDAAVAGFAVAMARGAEPVECLRLAVACGTANVLTRECAMVRPADVQALLPRIEIDELEG